MAFVKQPIKFLTMMMIGFLFTSGFALSIFVTSPHGVVHASSVNSDQNFYVQTNLVSDLPNIAKVQDPNLVNSWGLAHSPDGPWLVSDNGKGVATAYQRSGEPFSNSGSPLVITIPPPPSSPAGTTAAPTGVVFNNVSQTDSNDFVVTENGRSGPSIFLFATEDGTISGWNPNVDPTHALLEVDRSAVGLGAVYKGLAIGHSNNQDFIYATNFRLGTVEMFDAHFNLIRSFSDPDLVTQCTPTNLCFAPFGIQNIEGKLFVTFALQKAGKHDDQAGVGNGFVDVFDTQGNFLRRFASQGTLNSPWGLVLAPKGFGKFSNDLLVGNFGDGRINAFNPDTGTFLAQIPDQDGDPITINGLWGIAFGNGGLAGERDELFFASGLNDEANGLFGKIQVVTDD